MYWEDIVSWILIVVMIIVIGIAFIPYVSESNYECTTINNEKVNCIKVYTSYGSIYGITEDGTKFVLSSYKEIK